jgi:hypothetical protein
MEAMRQAELLEGTPRELAGKLDFEFPCSSQDTWWDLVKRMESIFRLVYLSNTFTFVNSVATHPVDAPDAAGRATADSLLSLERREHVVINFRFVRYGASLDVDTAFETGGNYIDLSATLPAGVMKQYDVTAEREYFENFTSTETGQVTQGRREVVPAGVQFAGMAAGLPGGDFRMSGQFTVASFTGTTGRNRSNVSAPLELDGPRRRWLKVMNFRSANGSMKASFEGLGLSLGAGLDNIAVFIKVD